MATGREYIQSIGKAVADLQTKPDETLEEFKLYLQSIDENIHGLLDDIEIESVDL